MAYKRLTNKNLDEYNPEIDFCSGCKYYGEPNGCNRPNGTCDSYDRFLETYNRLAELEDKIENGTLIELPCKVGDTVYRIRKACKDNYGYKDEFKCEPEWSTDCKHFSEDYEYSYCVCNGFEWGKKIEDPHINAIIYYDDCKERLCIQKEIFTYDKIDKIYNETKDYKNNYYNIFFVSKKEAEAKLKELNDTNKGE